MPSRTQFLTHRFAGGWAPDYGKLVSGFPNQTSEVRIPFVLEAENVFWQLDGGFRKIGGTTVIGSQMESGAFPVMGIYDYWRIGTAGSASRRRPRDRSISCSSAASSTVCASAAGTSSAWHTAREQACTRSLCPTTAVGDPCSYAVIKVRNTLVSCRRLRSCARIASSATAASSPIAVTRRRCSSVNAPSTLAL